MNILKAREIDIINNNISIKTEKHERIDYKNKICIKPWGYEYLAYESSKIGIWILRIIKNNGTSLHCHFNKDTQLIVLEGSAKVVLIDGEEILLPIMSNYYIPKYKFHGISSVSDYVIIMEIEKFENIDYSDKNDLLRIEDQYNRKSNSYEKSIDISYDLDTYNYMYFCDNFSTKNFDIDISVIQPDENFVFERDSMYIVLEGKIFRNNLYIHEGSILNDYEYKNIDSIKLLKLSYPYYVENRKIIYNLDHLKLLKKSLKNQKIILTSGCFDIIHVGHLEILKKSKLLGDLLIVCLSSDSQIKILKGDNRPINNYNDRINLFKTISYVDYIVLYDEEDIENEGTLDKIMRIIEPYYWTKGSDYNISSIIEKHPHLNIKIIENIKNISTTNIIDKINQFKP